MKNKNNILFISTMLIFGTIGIIVDGIPLSSGEIALYRAILAILVIGFYFLMTGQKITLKGLKKDLILLLISGVAMGINWILLFESYNYTTVSLATVSYYFAPVIVMVLAPLILKEKLTKKQVICFLISTIGLVLIVGTFEFKKGNANVIGILLGVLAACFYATVILINKKIKAIDGIQRTFLQFLASLIAIVPYTLLTSGINLFSISGDNFMWLLIVGIVHTGIAYCLYFSSMKELPSQKVSIFSYIDPMTSILLSFMILNERFTLLQLLGTILILGSTILNEINFKKRENKV